MFDEWHYNIYETPLGEIVIQDNGYGIARIEWIDGCRLKRGEAGETERMKLAYLQLMEYFNGKRKSFDFPIRIRGTAFQQKVWKTLQTIPYGEIRTYKEVGTLIGNEKAVRAVGMANNHNPLQIVIPCHRVIGLNGRLSGYSGGVERKQALLDLEKQYK